MAKKTNCKVNGNEYYRIYRKVGMKLNSEDIWVDDRKAFYGTSKKDAESKYAEYMSRKNIGSVEGTCIGALMDQWIETTFKQCDLKDSTKRNYISAYKTHFRHTELAGTALCDIRPMTLQDFYNNCDIAHGTLISINNLLKRFFNYVELTGLGRDITRSVVVPKKQKNEAEEFEHVDVWDDADLKKVIDSLEGHRLRLLVVLAVNTGARISELLALTYSDIKDDMLYITKQLKDESNRNSDNEQNYTTTKTYSSNRVIPLSDKVLNEITIHRLNHRKEMMENNYRTDNIFTTATGNHYYRKNISLALSRLYKRIGVPHHVFHSFRHTFGTNLSRAGVPIEETSKLMGHSSINVTAKYYINIDAKRKKNAVEKIVSYSL